MNARDIHHRETTELSEKPRLGKILTGQVPDWKKSVHKRLLRREIFEISVRRTSRDRFTAKDPIGFRGKQANLYAYVMDDPINWVDPNGKFSIIEGGVIVVGVGYLGYKAYNWLTNTEDAANSADAVRSDREKIQENIDAMWEGKACPHPEMNGKSGFEGMGKLSNDLVDLGLSSPPGTSLSGPPVNPGSALDVGGAIATDALINATDGR
jgi:hypothetical protein